MGVHVNVAGVWKNDTVPQINVAGVWKTPSQCSVNVAGVWKDTLSSLSVDIKSNGRYNYRYGSNCYTGERFYTTGVEYEITESNGSFGMGNWLTEGSNSDVWVSYARSGGTQTNFTGFTAGTRYQLSSNRSFYLMSFATLNQYKSISVTFSMYDAASGGNLLDTSASSTFIAEAEGGGGCPLCCFPAGTLVRTGWGVDVPIEKLQPGDGVVVFDPVEKKDMPQPVGELIVRENVPMFKIGFEDGRTIRTSPDHPFHTEGKGPANVGWEGTYKDVWVADKLQLGDRVATEDGGWLRITSIKRVANEPYVYTLSNTLFYANGLLVY